MGHFLSLNQLVQENASEILWVFYLQGIRPALTSGIDFLLMQYFSELFQLLVIHKWGRAWLALSFIVPAEVCPGRMAWVVLIGWNV